MIRASTKSDGWDSCSSSGAGEMAEVFELWVDQFMMGGADWESEIDAKLRICDIFILLVSARFRASKFILRKELPIVRERDARGEAVHIYPVLLTPTPILGLDNIREKNIRPADAKPLSGFSDHYRRDEMANIADEIGTLARRISRSRRPEFAHGQFLAGRVRHICQRFDIGHLPRTHTRFRSARCRTGAARRGVGRSGGQHPLADCRGRARIQIGAFQRMADAVAAP